jgi:adenylate cyclase
VVFGLAPLIMYRSSAPCTGPLGWGTVYYFMGHLEQAIAFLKSPLIRYPCAFGSHLFLAAASAELGCEEDARAEAAALLRMNPTFSVAVYRQRVPLKDPATLARHIAALRKAGLP